MKFNFRIGNIELRSCDEHLTNDNEHTRAEIVWWNKDYCYTLAYYQINTEDGYSNLSFVANRPFDDKVDPNVFMALAKLGGNILDLWYEAKIKAQERDYI